MDLLIGKNPTGSVPLDFKECISMITLRWSDGNQFMFRMFRTMLAENIDIEDDIVDELADAFMNTLPSLLRSKLQAA